MLRSEGSFAALIATRGDLRDTVCSKRSVKLLAPARNTASRSGSHPLRQAPELLQTSRIRRDQNSGRSGQRSLLQLLVVRRAEPLRLLHQAPSSTAQQQEEEA